MKTYDSNILLEKLRKGNITQVEHRQLELAALEDPFLFDAIEGYSLHFDNKDDTRSSLDKINQRITKSYRKSYKWALAAASFVILTSAVLMKMILNENTVDSTSIAMIEDQPIAEDAQPISSPIEKMAVIEELNSEKENKVASTSSPAKEHRQKPKSPQNYDENKAKKTSEIAQVDKQKISQESGAIADEHSTVEITDDMTANGDISLEEKTDSTALQIGSSIAFGNETTKASKDLSKKITNTKNKSDVGKFELKGSVIDKDGTPLIGVNIMSKNNGTITDFEGNFTIQIDTSDREIEVAYTGYTSKQLSFDSDIQAQEITVVLEEGMILDEIVITELGWQLADWTKFDESMTQYAIPTLFMHGIRGRYEVEYSFKVKPDLSIHEVFVIKSTHPIIDKYIKDWIVKSAEHIPTVTDELITRKLIVQ